MTEKYCSRCDTTKQTSEFYRFNGAKDGFHYNCKDCMKAKAKAWRERNPSRYAMLQARSHAKRKGESAPDPSTYIWGGRPIGKCDICEKESKLDRDHDHVTGVFRGDVCRSCNNRLARIEADFSWYKKVMRYMNKARSQL